MQTTWSQEQSPFHAGELAVQEALGVREKMDVFARKVVRDHLPQEHRDFYAELPFLMLGTVDDEGRPWASLVAGEPGFISSPDQNTIKVAAEPLPGDPLNETLRVGADVGLLGIQLETRRRNRLSGQIEGTARNSFSIRVDQAFGNCPRFIQTRAVRPLSDGMEGVKEHGVSHNNSLDADAVALIEQADTLFIATAYSEGEDDPAQGADVSHRGGKPGFVNVERDGAIVFPDFSGNNHFNTIGNIVANPKAGVMFIDFNKRDVLYLTGSAEIVWSGPEVDAFEKAQRLIRVRPTNVIKVKGSLPLSFDFGEYSPALKRTGDWG